MTGEAGGSAERQRLDKWLFFARVVKSRSLAQAHIGSGHVAVNGQAVRQASRLVAVGDKVEVTLPERDLVLIVRAGGERRGPYSEAQLLYEDQSPPPAERERSSAFEQAIREPGSGRPTKKDRRAIDGFLLGSKGKD